MTGGDIGRLQHMIAYCEDIAETITRFGQDYRIFTQDKDFFKSVSMSMMQIGELSGGLSEEFRDLTCEQMNWRAIKGMRNLFAHSYAAMNKEVIWKSAIRDIPNVLLFCNQKLEEYHKER